MDEKSLPVVPSSWEEGLGVVEKNNDITYYKSYVYEMVEPFLSLPPLTPPKEGGDYKMTPYSIMTHPPTEEGGKGFIHTKRSYAPV